MRPIPRPELLAVERPMPRPEGMEAASEAEAGGIGGEGKGGGGAEAGVQPDRDEAEPPEGDEAERPEGNEAEPPEGGGAGEVGEAPAGADPGWLEREGPICGLASVRGERVEFVEGEGGCGIVRPVRVEAVAGVALEPAPVLSCPAVEALEEWLAESAKAAFAAEGAGLVGLGIAAGYACRNVNYAEEGEVSEHARGLAIDIARFERADGETVTVLDGWGSKESGALLRDVHEDACGIFGTALGPDSDEYHQDHFHYDAAERRRPYCPARLEGEEADNEARPEPRPEEETAGNRRSEDQAPEGEATEPEGTEPEAAEAEGPNPE